MNKEQEAGARRVEALLSTYGCLPRTGDGPRMPHFDPRALAAGIECELNRAGEYGWTKITLHMDLIDAAALARFLRASVVRTKR